MEIIIGLLDHKLKTTNKGVEALGISNVKLLDEISKEEKIKFKYFFIGNQPKKIIEKYCENDYNIIERSSTKKMLLYKNKYIKDIKKCDCIFVLNGGDSFSDIYGLRIFLYLYLNMKYIVDSNTRMILSPQTIGPFKNKIVKRLAKNILKKTKLIFARDNISKKYCNEIIKKDKAIEATDVAFILPYNKNMYSNFKGKIKIGINVSGLLYNGGYKRNNQFGLNINYKKFINELVNKLLIDKNAYIYLIPHVFSSSFVEDDRLASKKIKENKKRIILAPKFDSAIEAKSYISNMDFFIGSRMHSTIAAISAGVPVVPVSYSRKFEGLYHSIGYNYVVNGRKTTNEKAIDFILKLINNPKEIKEAVKNSSEIIEKKSCVYKQKVKSLLEEIIDEKKK